MRIIVRADRVNKPAAGYQTALGDIALTDYHLTGIGSHVIWIGVEIAYHAINLNGLVDIARNDTVVVPLFGQILIVPRQNRKKVSQSLQYQHIVGFFYVLLSG